MRKLNTAQKIILVIGLIALAIRCFTYEPIIDFGGFGGFGGGYYRGVENKFNYNVVFHCLGIISATAVLMLIAGFLGDGQIAEIKLLMRKLKGAIYKAIDYIIERKDIVWVGIWAILWMVVIGALIYIYIRPRPLNTFIIEPSEIELFDMQINTSKTLSGRVKNNSSEAISRIELQILVYDSARRYIATGTATIRLSNRIRIFHITLYTFRLLPSEVRSFSERVSFATKELNFPTGGSWDYKIISIE